MRATVWSGETPSRWRMSRPPILYTRDAIVKITSTTICGSDLHLYDGDVPTMVSGDILGHEFMGEITEVGADVNNLLVGDRVLVPFPIACGNCYQCHRGMFSSARTPTPMRRWPRSCGATRRAASIGYS